MQRKHHISVFLLLTLCLFFSSVQMAGQDTSNPFELIHRLPEEATKTETAALPQNQNPFDLSFRKEINGYSDDPEKSVPVNPFDIVRSPSEPKATLKTHIADKEPQSQPTPTARDDGFIFWFMLFVMVFLALLVTFYKNLIVKIYRAFTNDNILKLLHREQGAVISFPYFLLYLLFFINAGVFFFFCARHFYQPELSQGYLYLCISGVTGFFLLKHILLKIIETIFPVQKEIKVYSFSIVVFSIILGLLLIPFNITTAFAAPEIVVFGIYGGLFTILAIYLFRFLRGLFIASKFLSFHKFHFFMYLCTVEIAPVVILIKILMNSAGIH